MYFDIVLTNKKYRGMDRELPLSELLNGKSERTYLELLERYYLYLEDVQRDNQMAFERVVGFYRELQQYDIGCEMISYALEPLEEVFGYSVEFLGFDIVHDMCESLLVDEINENIVDLLNENGLCDTELDVERIIPFQHHGNLEWNPCYVYRIDISHAETKEKKIGLITILNCSSKNVKVRINDKLLEIIEQGENILYDTTNNERVKIVLTHDAESFVKHKKVHMLIETTYEFVPEDGMVYSVRREKMRIESDAYYDCFFLYCGNEDIVPEKYRVIDTEKLRSELIHTGVFWKFMEPLEDMLEDMIFAPIRTLLISGLIVTILGWKWLLCIGVFIYVLYLIGYCLGGGIAKILSGLLGDKFKTESIEDSINRWTDFKFIEEFYSNPNRKPYMGKVER